MKEKERGKEFGEGRGGNKSKERRRAEEVGKERKRRGKERWRVEGE